MNYLHSLSNGNIAVVTTVTEWYVLQATSVSTAKR